MVRQYTLMQTSAIAIVKKYLLWGECSIFVLHYAMEGVGRVYIVGNQCNRAATILLYVVKILDVRRLIRLDVAQMRLDDQNTVDVEGHPGEVEEGSKNHLQVNVVAEY